MSLKWRKWAKRSMNVTLCSSMQVQYERELRLQYTLLTCSGACEKCNKPDYTLGGHLMAVLKWLYFISWMLGWDISICSVLLTDSILHERQIRELSQNWMYWLKLKEDLKQYGKDFSQPLCRQLYHWAKFERCMIWTHVHKMEIWNNEKHDIKRFDSMVPINEKEKYMFSFQTSLKGLHTHCLIEVRLVINILKDKDKY